MNANNLPQSGEVAGQLEATCAKARRMSGRLVGCAAVLLGAVAAAHFLPGDAEACAAASLAGYLYYLGIGAGAAAVLAVMRLTRAEWRRPLARPAELLAMMVLLALAIYPLARYWRSVLWASGSGAEHASTLWPWSRWSYDWTLDLAVGLPMFVMAGLVIWMGIRPDVKHTCPSSALRFRVVSAVQLVFLVWGLAWFGWEFGMTAVPHWETTLFGPYYIATSLLHGVAALAVAAILMRRLFGLGQWLTPHHLDQLSKLMIGFVLIWFYMSFAEFLTVWYGHVPHEMAALRARTAGISPVLFAFTVAANFLVPLLYLSFPRLRRCVSGVCAVSLLILVGGMAEWVLLFAPGSIPGGGGLAIAVVRMLLLPAVLLLFVAACFRFVAPLSVWEVEEGILSRGSVRLGEKVIATYPLVDLPRGSRS